LSLDLGQCLAAEAGLITFITRLMDFTTPRDLFQPEAKLFRSMRRGGCNQHRPHRGGMRGETVDELAGLTAEGGRDMDGKAAPSFTAMDKMATFPKPTNSPVPTYAQIVGVVNGKAGTRDYAITASGGLPGEMMKNWRVKSANSFDVEFGFSCMGYEIAGGSGAAIADPTRETFVMVGDGAYMMMNSDIYSSVLAGHKLIVVVCDNGGYAVINRLQNFKGGVSFNNLIKDCKVKEPFSVDYAKHAESMGPGGGLKVWRNSAGLTGPNHGPHPHCHHHCFGCHLDAGRCAVGCGRAAGEPAW
jgi:3D-(3,5/4)-trihydroxycyclohexane-1,2-dione acylhydrolase (decyclizing)